jgi:hypothetical protein
MNRLYRKSLDGLKIVREFPNPVFFDVEYKNSLYRLHLITDDNNKIFIKKLNESERAWYCPQIKTDEIVMLSGEWFPKELIAGVINGRYDASSYLSRATGWVQSFNTGSNAECFRSSRVIEAIYILEKNGFVIQY